MLLTRRWTDEVEAYLAGRYDLTRNELDRPMTADELRAGMLTHDALCPTVTDRIDAALLETRDARVKIVGNFGVGFNHVDVTAARRREHRGDQHARLAHRQPPPTSPSRSC